MHRLARISLFVSIAGCATPSPAVDAATDGASSVGAVTYYGDVRPLLTDRCVSCHADGSIAPFAFDSYEHVRPMAGVIAAATRARTMPPFLADGSGACQTFQTTRWLSEHEIAVLEAWRDQNTPEGDATIPAPVAPTLPTLAPPVSSLDIGADCTPNATQSDDYRCFVVEAPVATGNYFVTGSEMHPGNARIVHHAIVYAPTTDAQAQAAMALDAAQDGPGYTCFGGAGVTAMPIALWAPGAGAVLYPTNTGVQVAGGRPLIVQIHYNVAAAPGTSDHSHFDLQIVSSGVTPAYWVPVADYELQLPPHMSSVSATSVSLVGSLTHLNVPLHAYGTGPHMHTLGRTMRVELTHETEDPVCMVDITHWDFNWQAAYFYETPVAIAPDDILRITCEYDTSARSDMVTWGENTSDEMCIDFLYLSL